MKIFFLFFSAAPSSDGSLLKNQWPSQSDLHQQIEDKSREIEKLKSSLQQAESKLEVVEARITTLVGVSREGVMSLRQELSSVRCIALLRYYSDKKPTRNWLVGRLISKVFSAHAQSFTFFCHYSNLIWKLT